MPRRGTSSTRSRRAHWVFLHRYVQPGCKYSNWYSLGYQKVRLGIFTRWQRSRKEPDVHIDIVGEAPSINGGGVGWGCFCFYDPLFTYIKYRVLEHLMREKTCPVCQHSKEYMTVRKGFAYEQVAAIYKKGWQLRHGGVMLADGCLCPDFYDDGAGAF
jgi:hypothetical protein